MHPQSGVIILEPPVTIKSPMTPWDVQLTSYGILSILHVLKRLEEDGFYEVCAEIRDAIIKTEELVNFPLPKHLDDVKGVDKIKQWAEKKAKEENLTPLREEARIAYSNTMLYELGYLPRYEPRDFGLERTY